MEGDKTKDEDAMEDNIHRDVKYVANSDIVCKTTADVSKETSMGGKIHKPLYRTILKHIVLICH